METKKDKSSKIDKTQLLTLLKISDPFLMIDEVTNLKEGSYGEGTKNLNSDEWFYKCHFTDDPIMPGTLQVEAMLQTIVSILYSNKELDKKKFLITKSSSNFYSKINTSGELKIKAQIIKNERGAVQAKAELYFNGKKTSDGIFKFINPDILKI